MKRKACSVTILALLALLLIAAGTGAIPPIVPSSHGGLEAGVGGNNVGTSFTYQGRLTDGGIPANGTYDFRFGLYDHPIVGSQIGITVTRTVTVTNGLFTEQLDFGSGVFNGDARWMEVGVRPGDSTGAYTTLTPRQALTPAPYAIHSSSAGSAESAPWGGLTDIPSGFADGVDDDTQLSEVEVENFVTNDPLNLAGGTTLGGENISTLVSDGCEGIQMAINALPPTGGQVIVQAGTYTCTAPIVIDRDSVDLRGQGPATILRLADGANAPVLVLGQVDPVPTITHRNIRVSDLVIDGNRLNQTFECWGEPCSPTNPLRNNGITLRRVSDVLVERVTVFGARSGGLVSELGSRRVTVSNFTSFDNHFDGMAAYETEDSTFLGLYLYDNLKSGLSFDIRFDHNTVGDATITGSGTVGIFMRDSRDNEFHGLQIRNSGEHGIFLAQVDTDPTKPASGNTFSGVVVSESGGAGLRVNDQSCVNNLVDESQFIGNNGGCISEVIPGLVVSGTIICR